MSEIIRGADTIAAEINGIKSQVRATVASAAVEIGRRLIEAKRLIAHGSWGEWLQNHVDYSERTAQQMMKLADEYRDANSQALADLSYTKAVLLLGVPSGEREEFVKTHDVEGMSTRALQAEIDRLREENSRMQATVDEMIQAPAEMLKAGNDLNEARKALAEAEKGIKQAKRQQADTAKELKDKEARAWELEKQLAEASTQAEKAQQEKSMLEEALKKAGTPIIQQVTPPEVEEELRKLRAVASRSREETELRAGFENMKDAFSRMERLMEVMALADAAAAKPYRAAFGKALRVMAERITGVKGGE